MGKLTILLGIVAMLLFIALLVMTCPSCGPYTPTPPVDPEAGTPEDCPAACANLEELQCPGWEGAPGPDGEYGTEDDTSCTEVCITLMESDPSMTLFPVCTARAASCEEVDTCFEGGY